MPDTESCSCVLTVASGWCYWKHASEPYIARHIKNTWCDLWQGSLGIKDRAADMSFCSGLVEDGGGGCHTRHGEYIYFLGPWVCAEVLLGGLITHSEPWAWGSTERPALHPPSADRCVIPSGVVEWARNDERLDTFDTSHPPTPKTMYGSAPVKSSSSS